MIAKKKKKLGPPKHYRPPNMDEAKIDQICVHIRGALSFCDNLIWTSSCYIWQRTSQRCMAYINVLVYMKFSLKNRGINIIKFSVFQVQKLPNSTALHWKNPKWDCFWDKIFTHHYRPLSMCLLWFKTHAKSFCAHGQLTPPVKILSVQWKVVEFCNFGPAKARNMRI